MSVCGCLQGEVIHSPELAAPGLVLLVLGVAAIAFNGQLAEQADRSAANGEPAGIKRLLQSAL